MSVTDTPAERLLASLRRSAGDAPISARFNPAQWLAIANQIGLSEAERKEAVAQLRALDHVRFSPESTEILALTSCGVKAADQMDRRRSDRKLTDPMPDTLERIREELDYWEPRLYLGDPGSIWWEQVQARLVGLRHRENRLLSSQPSVSVTNNAFGPNSRFNQNSVDQSTNQTNDYVKSSDWERIAEKLSGACRFIRADSQWTSTVGKEVWRIAGGDGGLCTVLLQQAGAMLLKSPKVRAQLGDQVLSERDDLARWLLFLKDRGFHEVSFPAYEEGENGTRISHLLGGIRDLPNNSVVACMQCAAWEI